MRKLICITLLLPALALGATKTRYRMIEGSPVNVLDFGADPTGVADSTSAIQAAVNAGRNVYFPAGVYGITAAITVPSGAHLIGVRGNASGQHTWLRQDSADYHLSVVGSSGAYNQYTEIAGFTFTGASGLGIRTAYTEGLQVHDNNFSGIVYGLYMSTNANEEDVKPHIFRNTFGAISGSAIWTGDTRLADGWIKDNTFLDVANYAIRIGYLDGGLIVGNAVFSTLASGTENNGFLIHKPVWSRIDDNQFFEVNGTGLLVTSPRWTHIERNVAVWTGKSNRKEAFKIYSYTATAANDVWIRDNVAREVYGPGFTISFSVASSDIDVIDNHVTTAGYTSTSLVNDGFVLNGITRLRLHDNSVEGASLTRYWATFQSITGGDIVGNTHQNCVNDGPYLNSGNTSLWFKDASLSTANATRAIGYHESVVTSDATSGAVNLTLPSASITGAGKRITVVKVDSGSNAVGIAGTGGQTINGASSYSLTAQWQRVVVVSNGSNWIIESSN